MRHKNFHERVREGSTRNCVLQDEHILHTLAFELTLDLVTAKSCSQQPPWNLSPKNTTNGPSPLFLSVHTWRIPTPTLLELLIHWSYHLFTVPYPLSPSFPVILHINQFKHSLHCIHIAVLFSLGKHHILMKSNLPSTSGLHPWLEWKHNHKDGLILHPRPHPYCF